MGTVSADTLQPSASRSKERPWLVAAVALLLGVGAIVALVGGVILSTRSEGVPMGMNGVQTALAGVILAGLGALLAQGTWTLKDWARTGVINLLGMGLLFFLVKVLFDVSAEIFAGEQIMPVGDIFGALGRALIRVVAVGAVPGLIIFGLTKLGAHFDPVPGQRVFVDRAVRYLLVTTSLCAIFIVFLIILFTLREAWLSVEEIGLERMLTGTIWRPGAVIGTEEGQFGLVPMIVGSILSTFGAIVLGVPLSVGAAILLAEVAPQVVREIVRPAVELLAGIPSVVYGLFGMVVLAPLIRNIPVPYNTGFGLLNASFILAVMIVPTVTNIAEDAIRAVPRRYKEGSLALGATRWQTIRSVTLPAARSGIVAAVILGIGRALGETMALIMVIGNSIGIPEPLNDNPLTLFLSTARTLTGNIAVEITYAPSNSPHRSALFFTGVLLFAMILIVNSLARFLMRERVS